MTIPEYLDKIDKRYRTGISTEHSYRGDLQNLLETLVTDAMVTNEPSRIACGAPDYILTRKNIPIGYIEAKDLGADLDNTLYQEQFSRYRASLDNLIITNYLDFRLYHDGAFVTALSLGSIRNGKISGNPDQFVQFFGFIRDFSIHIGQTIRSAEKLAKMMAGKARMLANVIENALTEDKTSQDDVGYKAENNSLHEQLSAFKSVLIHDIEPKEFADIYAQTITYGMFAARLHDQSLDTFSRQEAAELIPKSNPFLRKLFQYVAGYDLDDRLKWIVDALADIFRATDVAAILKNFGKSTRQSDPVIHFYETFLGEYDPKLRKSRGVWYTPEPVVNFIVRAVDDILRSEFGLKDGLADISKTKVRVKIPVSDNRMKVDGQKGYTEVEQEVHKVQILDPATGTGTFLAEIIKQVYKKFDGQQGIWSQYAEDHLIPRLNGFEILMAPYAMAHLKLDLLLAETGYKPKKEQRFRIYLTNSLEEFHPDTGTLFANWLSTEANEANYIKRDTPVMVIIGNPPYRGESQNKGKWVKSLLDDYKVEPGGQVKLNERNYKWLNDDYVKFLRYGQYLIDNNGEGVLAFINPHGFLYNPTFRGMRWNLLKTYDKIYTLDLHGNAKKKETSSDGRVDENVFDIQQGVSINFFIKTGKKRNNELGQVFHFDLFGGRQSKYGFLFNNSMSSTSYTPINNTAPNYFFYTKDFERDGEHSAGFFIPDLFQVYSLGMLTKRDDLALDFDMKGLEAKIQYFLDGHKTVEEVCDKFNLAIKDKDKWDANQTRNNLSSIEAAAQIRNCEYRPFDNRKVVYNPWFVARPNTRVLGNFSNDNLGLIICRQGQAVGGDFWNTVFICKTIQERWRDCISTLFIPWCRWSTSYRAKVKTNP